ncbi:MAG: glycosyltransferase family 2 protein [Phycisphaerales bacterium]|nr:glycosyltransferase family 2 protein [Phycisphaerales bacterium]
MEHQTHQSDKRFELAIVVLNYKTPGLVIDCLESLDGQVDPGSQEVVVVDNCSGDDSPDQIEAAIQSNNWGCWARVVRSPVNGGFAAGNNVGIKATDAEVYILLNSDTIVRDGAIKIMMDTLEEHPEIDILGPQLEWLDGGHQTSTFRYRTPLSDLLYASGLGIFWKLFPKHEVARELHEFTLGLDWVSFACVAIRSEVFQDAGFLDERYFMYYEDMAMCREATKAGFWIAYQPDAHVVHLRGGSSPVKEQTKNRKRRPAYYYAARSRYLRSFYGVSGHVLSNLLWLAGWFVSMLRGRAGAVKLEWIDIWKSPKHQVQIRAGR